MTTPLAASDGNMDMQQQQHDRAVAKQRITPPAVVWKNKIRSLRFQEQNRACV